MPDLAKYRQLFLTESAERIAGMQKHLLALEKGDDHEAVDEFFREAHSLKGMAAAMGHESMRALAHALEDVMAEVRDGTLEFDSELADQLLSATELLGHLRSQVEADAELDDTREPVRALRDRAEKARVENAEKARPSRGGMPRIDLPPTLPTPTPAPPPPRRDPQPPPEPARVPSSAESQKHVRISTELLDRLIDSLGEVMAARNVLSRVAQRSQDPEAIKALMRMDRAVTELRQDVVASRMAPMTLILDKLPLVARNVSRPRGKQVEATVTGGNIEIDRTILAALDQPLLHLVRNCVDHGIEPPEERYKLKKPTSGKLEINISQERDLVVIDVQDDGRGMDPGALRAAAVERGLKTAEEVELLSDEDALYLVCLPGFTSRDEVTDVSGRGVGMDVVKTTVERFGGQLELWSKPGEGMRATLRLPRLVALMNVILLETSGEILAVPMARVERTLEVSTTEVEQDDAGYRLLVDGERLPVQPLSRALRLDGSALLDADTLRGVVTRGPGGGAVFTVDRILGLQEVVVKPLGPPLERIPALNGVTLLAGGRPVFVLDPQKLATG